MDEKELVRYLVSQVVCFSKGVVNKDDPEDQYSIKAYAYLDVLQAIGHEELADMLEKELF